MPKDNREWGLNEILSTCINIQVAANVEHESLKFLNNVGNFSYNKINSLSRLQLIGTI